MGLVDDVLHFGASIVRWRPYNSDSYWCPSDEFEGLVSPLELGGVTNKRARSRRRHKKAKRDATDSKECDDVTDLHASPGRIEWVDVQDGKWPTILTRPADCEALKDKISDLSKGDCQSYCKLRALSPLAARQWFSSNAWNVFLRECWLARV